MPVNGLVQWMGAPFDAQKQPPSINGLEELLIWYR